MSKLKIGVIGGGGITGAHLPHLSKHPGVELVALADLNPAAVATAQKYGIPQFFNDYREILPLVDAVLICVPTWLHAGIAVEALHLGKAVFCEKPLARTLEQAVAIETAAKESGSPLQIGFVRRFDAEWLGWRDTILSEKIGRPVVWHDLVSISGPVAPWYYREEQGGGPFLDGCIHNLDFALHTFGPAEWVFCNGRTFRSEASATAIDTGTTTIRFQSGDELLLAWSWGLPPNAPAARVFELIGPGGSVTWSPDKDVESGLGHFVVHQGTAHTNVPFPLNSITQAFAAQMDEFVQVARREKSPRAGITEGRAALDLALAVLQSARTNEVVHL